MTHANVNQNSQLELRHLPSNDMQLYNIQNDIKKNFIDNIIVYSPLSIKNIIEKKYKLNNLQATLFKNFNESTTKYHILQCIGGATGIKKNKVIQDYSLTTRNQQNLRVEMQM